MSAPPANEASPAVRSPVPPEYRGHLGFLVAKARQLLSEQMDARLSASGYSVRHFAVLGGLGRQSGLRQTDLCDTLGIDRTTIMKLVDDLERGGLLQRNRHPDDRRAYVLELTDAGQAAHARMLVPILAEEEQFLAPLSPGERALLQEMLLRLVERALDRKQTNSQST
ncbi:MAG: MarR family transcriptional regulator [Hydrocarboniphaga sp.]|uniref:MarR family winged helix-turn-helix transcriptional regulator n=1 Tax=Hydrocarboniphaga sp. TaxID=2033016 RepID=UPI00260E59C9|nr:MarR family transcriptional regulator [Hydrocarboniphaga sp.]MDB5972991.1 MarR family transcriptional regulator [Hydrocarboniphaga sp.]